MRLIKPKPEDLIKLVTSSVDKLMAGTRKITLDINTLLKLDKPHKDSRPLVTISETANLKMKALVKATNKEIAWHGLVDQQAPLHYVIQDILVYPQEVTGTTVDSDDDLYPLWLDELEDEEFNSIRMQGHSHVNMGVIPSGTDLDFYETLTTHIKDYYIFIILNKNDKMYIELRDIKNNTLYEPEDIDVIIEGQDFTDWAEEQIKEYIITRSYYQQYKHSKRTFSKSVGYYGKSSPNYLQDDSTKYDDPDIDWDTYNDYLDELSRKQIGGLKW